MSGANVIRLGGGDDPFDEVAPSPELPDGPKDHGGKGGDDPPRIGEQRFGPVVPLGVRTRRGVTCYVFLDSGGLETTLAARDLHTAAVIDGLFGGRERHAFLMERWPHFVPARDSMGKVQRGEDGRPEMIEAGWSARECAADLITACTRIGAADDAELRRDGVWSDGAGGLTVHCGNVVYAGDKAHPPGLRQGRAIYIAAPRREKPAREPATPAECRALENDLRLWTFAPQHEHIAPQLLVGMIACGILSASLSWRPHMTAWGPAGAGKSTLARLMAAACGIEEASTDVSEPGIRRLFNARSGLIPLDENEAQAAHATAVLNLMRGASDGGGAKVIRAQSDGSGVDVFRVAGCFFFAAINPPHLSLADASRITLILLRRGPAGDDRKKAVEAACARAGKLYPRLLTRLVLGIGRYRENFDAFRGAAIAGQATSRSADQVAALLAGWQTLVSDEAVTEADAAHVLEGFGDILHAAEDVEEEDAGRQVLRHLLGSVVQVDTSRMTVAQVIGDGLAAMRAHAEGLNKEGEFARLENWRKWRKRLGAIGLRYAETPRPGVYVANGAPQIEAAFSGTPWAHRAWQRPLRELPGASESPTSIKFAGNGQSRAVLLPLDLLPLGDPDET